MKNEIMRILPFFEPRLWGGDRLKTEFGYETDIHPIGEVYNVVALRGHADCVVEGKGLTLSQLYADHSALFQCDTGELPIRVNILDPIADLSIQLHPTDEYALSHSQSRGKPEAWVILDCPEDGYIQFGHHASSRREFAELAEAKRWKELCRYLTAKKDWFIDIPAGTLHAIGKNVLTYNISRNADCTYRLYDYDRVDPATGTRRDLHVQSVIDNVVIPDHTNDFVYFEPRNADGCELTEYWDEPGLYTLKRIKVASSGSYEHDRFAFYTVVDGAGAIDRFPVKKGDTVFVPHGRGRVEFTGPLDMFMASYENR